MSKSKRRTIISAVVFVLVGLASWGVYAIYDYNYGHPYQNGHWYEEIADKHSQSQYSQQWATGGYETALHEFAKVCHIEPLACKDRDRVFHKLVMRHDSLETLQELPAEVVTPDLIREEYNRLWSGDAKPEEATVYALYRLTRAYHMQQFEEWGERYADLKGPSNEAYEIYSVLKSGGQKARETAAKIADSLPLNNAADIETIIGWLQRSGLSREQAVQQTLPKAIRMADAMTASGKCEDPRSIYLWAGENEKLKILDNLCN